MENKQKVSKVKVIFSIVIFIGIIWYFAGGGLESQVAKDMQKIENQVALDAEKQYDIAKKGNDKMQTYVQASMVAAA